VLGDQSATCEARILWVADNIYQTNENSCLEAHADVLKQCDICGRCPIAETTCTRGAGTPAPPFEEFDCAGSAEHLSAQQQAWCCQHKGTGCVFLAHADGFKQKFDGSLGAVADATPLGRRGLRFFGASAGWAGAVGLSVLLLLVVAVGAIVGRRSSGAPSARLAYARMPLEPHLNNEC